MTRLLPLNTPEPTEANYLRLQRDYYRRNRDLTIIFSILAYGMQIVEATVGAHMNEFDISDDLSMNWHPSFQTHFPDLRRFRPLP
jgi:hypothetical protein